MPWKHTEPMTERMEFVVAYRQGLYPMSELCDRFGVSRKTGYKWRSRFEQGGLEALQDQSRAHRQVPHQMPEKVRALLLEVRSKHPTWGPKKIRAYLARRHPEESFPAPSTIGDLLRREGLVRPRGRRQRKWGAYEHSPLLVAAHPNDLWLIDFKGEFRLGNGRYCYPLTVSDANSRYLLSCRALPSTASAPAEADLLRLFHQFGLPSAIRSDNGEPFVTRAVGGLSRMNIIFAKLGIHHERIEMGHPEQNGRHERMHRTLKAEATRPVQGSFESQQQVFDQFRHCFNEERPHEALGQLTPASLYRASCRAMPARIPEPEYPPYFEVRRVAHSGTIKWRSGLVFLSSTLAGEYVGLEEIDDGIWSVYFFHQSLGRFDERKRKLVS